MNRLVLIGNGFDLAHGLKTSYKDFIYWYWKQRVLNLRDFRGKTSDDGLCKFTILAYDTWRDLFYYNQVKISSAEDKDFFDVTKNKEAFEIEYSPLFERIHKSIETKKWVDIENDYYDLLKEYALSDDSAKKVENLNRQLQYIKELLIKYLGYIEKQKVAKNESIKEKIYAPIKLDDISVSGKNILKEWVDSWMKQDESFIINKMHQYGWKVEDYIESIRYFRNKYHEGKIPFTDIPRSYLLPDAVMLLNFNYTQTAQFYHDSNLGFINYIHGKIDNPQSIIFGYGDELDDDYKKLQKLNVNDCLTNVKSIKYLESDNYRRLLSFAESAPFQIYIMGHSCGNSDRTLLNTLFEHRNCISIKPYYYVKKDGTDNYLELVQNTSRNFTDMKLMRDRVVNKEYCEPLTNRNNN